MQFAVLAFVTGTHCAAGESLRPSGRNCISDGPQLRQSVSNGKYHQYQVSYTWTADEFQINLVCEVY